MYPNSIYFDPEGMIKGGLYFQETRFRLTLESLPNEGRRTPGDSLMGSVWSSEMRAYANRHTDDPETP